MTRKRIDRGSLAKLMAAERERFAGAHPRSAAVHRRAGERAPHGVTSTCSC